MTAKERLISNMHKIQRDDVYIIEILNSTGIEIDELETSLQDIYNQFGFTTMTWGADALANEMQITFDPMLTQEEKNSIVAAKWKSDSKCDLKLIQAVCESWRKGKAEVSFLNGTIVLKFIDIKGIPTDIESLKKQIGIIKPAHLGVSYIIVYRTHGELRPKTHGELQAFSQFTLREGEI